VAALCVGGLIADHPGVGKGEAEVVAGLQQKSRGRLAAFAYIRVAGGAPFGVVQAITKACEADAFRGQGSDEPVLDGPVGLKAGLAQRKVRLIGNQDQRITCVLETAERGDDAVDEAEVLGRKGGLHPAGGGIEHGWIEHPVAVEKNGGPRYFADSHFISLVRSRGWETIRCQTTA
jgi:hypothetical protein